MKKILVTSILSLTAAVAFGQGTVFFANDPGTLTSPPDRLIRFASATTAGNVTGVAGAGAVGTNYQVQLYYGASTAADSSLVAVSTAPARLRGSTTTSVGIWSSGGSRTFSGFDFGSGAVKLQVRVWDINDGLTYDAAFANAAKTGAIGTSQSFLYTLPTSSAAPAGDFYMVNFQGFTIDSAAIPEPSTFALAGLGAAAMLIFRRRKQ